MYRTLTYLSSQLFLCMSVFLKVNAISQLTQYDSLNVERVAVTFDCVRYFIVKTVIIVIIYIWISYHIEQ